MTTPSGNEVQGSEHHSRELIDKFPVPPTPWRVERMRPVGLGGRRVIRLIAADGRLIVELDNEMALFEQTFPHIVAAVNAYAPTPASGKAQEGSEAIAGLVANAMLEAWNIITSDTECHPLDLTHGEGKRCTELWFEPGHWARLAGDIVAAKLAAPLPSPSPATVLQRPEDTPATGDAIALLNELIRVGRSADGSLELDLRRAITALQAENKRLREALSECVAAFGNHGRTTSLAEWDKALKAAVAQARSALAS